MANRGNVVYTEAATISKLADANASDISNMCNIIKLNLQEAVGYNLVKNNPDDYSAGVKRYRTGNSGSESALDTLKSKIAAKADMTAADINSILTHEDTLLGNLGMTKMSTSVSKGADNLATVLNTASTNLKSVSTFFDGKNSWWDSSNYCKLSCQTACQAACQLACQSCQYNTCHAQNCGGWS